MTVPEPGRAPSGLDRRTLIVLALIVTIGFIVRITVAASQPSLYDEEHVSIPLAEQISFHPGNLYLPVRGIHHPALPSYVVKASGAIFGKTRLGYRGLHVFLGTLSLGLIFLLAKRFGATTALWATALVALNEYHIGVSAFATAKGPHLILVLSAMVAFSRFLETERPRHLWASAVAIGAAFYAKEHSALLLPAFGLLLLTTRYRVWLLRWQTYAAVALFFVVISPDVIWNLGADTSGGPLRTQATYSDHLARIGGLGLNPHPFMFFAHGAVRSLHQAVTGTRLADDVAENASMNPILGVVLFTAAILAWGHRHNPQIRVLLYQFWFIFVFMVIIKPGRPNFDMDDVAWYWVDMVLFPAAVLAGVLIASASGRWLRIAATVAACGMLLAVCRTVVWWPFVDEDVVPKAEANNLAPLDTLELQRARVHIDPEQVPASTPIARDERALIAGG